MSHEQQTISWGRRAQFAAWALPMLLATVHQVAGSASRPIGETPRRPGLAFEQYLIDYGPVVPTEEVRTHFAFLNTSDSPIEITRLEPSCGCLQPQLAEESRQLDPEERGEFLVRIQTANQSVGPKEYRVVVHYNDPEPRSTTVVFRVTLPDNQVVMKPRALMMYLFGDNPTVQTAELIDRRPRKLGVINVTCEPAELGTAVLTGEEDDAEGHRHFKLRVAVNPELSDGSYRGAVYVHTDDPAYATVRLPLAIQRGQLKKGAQANASRTRAVESARRRDPNKHVH